MLKKKVVAVDMIGRLLVEHEVLKNVGIETFSASTNEEALHLHRLLHVDLIFTDLTVGGMSSVAVCNAIRKDRVMRDVSLVMVCPDERSAAWARSTCRVNAVFSKPLDPEVIKLKAYEFLTVYKRATYRTAVTLTAEKRGKKLTSIGRSENISATGMLLISDQVLALNDTIRCSFFIPNSNQINTRGKVVRSEPHPSHHGLRCYGIKFAHISGHTKLLIDRFVQMWSHFPHLTGTKQLTRFSKMLTVNDAPLPGAGHRGILGIG
jgi:CheY-like chemotaxis protein